MLERVTKIIVILMKQKIAKVRWWICDPVIVEAQNKLSKGKMKGKLRRVLLVY